MRQTKFLLLIFLIFTPEKFSKTHHFKKAQPEKISNISNFLQLDSQRYGPLPKENNLTEKTTIHRYTPPSKLTIPENFRLTAKNDESRYSLLPFIATQTNKNSDELEIFWGLNFKTKF